MLLTEQGFAETRTAAQRLIAAGAVHVDGNVVEKSNRRFPSGASILVAKGANRYVSRGGEKLEFAIEQFGITVSGRRCLDIGISTGGFTDCLLQYGAANVVGIDVGHGQLATKLQSDDRVTLIEGLNARDVSNASLGPDFNVIVIDVSFISLKLILPSAKSLLAADGDLICLIKPQFEVGVTGIGKNGVVTDSVRRKAALVDVHRFGSELGLVVINSTQSPIKGGSGNIEYLSYFRNQ